MAVIDDIFHYFDANHAKIYHVMSMTQAQWEIWLQVELHLHLLTIYPSACREVNGYSSQGPIDFDVNHGGNHWLIELKTQSHGTGGFAGSDAYQANASDINKLDGVFGSSLKLTIMVGRHIPVNLSRLPPSHVVSTVATPSGPSNFKKIWSAGDKYASNGRTHRTTYFHASYAGMQVGINFWSGSIPDSTQHYYYSTGSGWSSTAPHRAGGEYESVDSQDMPSTPR
ncbi:MAG: hypothetical protein AAGB12_08220 [Pseudomonadota bacterium]